MLKTKTQFRVFVCTAIILIVSLFIPKSNVTFGKTTEVTITRVDEKIQPNAQKEVQPQTETGKAKYYSGAPKGKRLTLTAAHKTLSKGTIVKVESLEGDKFKPIEVEITDRLPDIPINKGTIIDLSKEAAIAMNPNFIRKGVLKVKLTVIEKS